MPMPKTRRIITFIGEALIQAIQRLDNNMASTAVEVWEFLSIWGNGAFAATLLTHPSYLAEVAASHPNEHQMSPAIVSAIYFTLFFGQFFAVVFGGKPSAFIKSARGVRIGFKIRAAFMWSSLTIWIFLTWHACITMGITPGLWFLVGITLFSFAGALSLNKLLRTEEDYQRWRLVMDTGEDIYRMRETEQV